MGILELLGGYIALTTLQGFLGDIIKDITKDYFRDSSKLIFKLIRKNSFEKAIARAIKDFLILLEEYLEANANCTINDIKQHKKGLKQFLKDKTVQKALRNPFDDPGIFSIDFAVLASAWGKYDLPDLKGKKYFLWEDIAKQYLVKSKLIIRKSPDLRPIWDSAFLESIYMSTKEEIGVIPTFNFIQYQEALSIFYSYLKLDSFDVTGYKYNIKLWDVFVPQHVKESIPPKEIPKEIQRFLLRRNEIDKETSRDELLELQKRYMYIPSMPVLDIIENKRYNRIIILGDPGSGKSSLLQYIALDWCKYENESKSLPILIELRKYAHDGSNPKNFLNYLQNGKTAFYHLPQHYIHDHLIKGNCLFLLDGLDEVFDVKKRDTIITEIIRFSTEYEKCRIIVTSRIIGYREKYFREAGFNHFTLQDFSEENISSFIDKWHNEAFHNEEEKIYLKNRLKQAIESSQSIYQLAINPLLLTMICILNRNQELPRDRAELYEQASKVLLYEWDFSRNLKDIQLDIYDITYKEKQSMLRKIAHEMQTASEETSGNLIHEEHLSKLLYSELLRLEIVETKRESIKVANGIINQLRERNFILCYVGAGYYSFVHRTFLEFFCAWFYVRQFEKEKTININHIKYEVFLRFWKNEKWHEILTLITSMLSATFSAEIVEFLLNQTSDKNSNLNIFLAASCFSSIQKRKSIRSIEEKLFYILSTLAVKELKRNDSVSKEKKDSQTVKRNKSKIKENEKLENNAEYEEIFSSFGDIFEEFFGFGTKSDSIKAIQIISEIWPQSKEAFNFFCYIIRESNNKNLLNATLKELIKNWKDSDDTYSLLIRSVFNSEANSNIRLLFIDTLYQYFISRSKTIVLFNTILNDQNENEEIKKDIKEKIKMYNMNDDGKVIYL